MILLPETSAWSEVFVAASAGIHSFACVGGIRNFRVRRAADSLTIDLNPPYDQGPDSPATYLKTFSVYLAAGDALDSIDGNAGSPYDQPASLAGVRLGDELFDE